MHKHNIPALATPINTATRTASRTIIACLMRDLDPHISSIALPRAQVRYYSVIQLYSIKSQTDNRIQHGALTTTKVPPQDL